MKKQLYGFGMLAFALVLSGVPAIVSAERGDEDGQTIVQAQSGSTSTTVRTDDEDATSSEDRGEGRKNGTSTSRARLEVGEDANENARENSRSFLFALESTTTPVWSNEQLKRSIEQRKHELDDEEASTTTPRDRDLLKNANPVRLAVHSLLASKDVLGGIGQQVSEIAKRMNDSVATTTNAEVKIKSRGFFKKFFFGGDAAAANVIKDELAKNQLRIDDLNKLLGEANVSADIQVTLKAQIAALQDAQARLKALADKEQSMWGLFSWRF